MLILRTRHLYRPSDDLHRSQSKIKTIKMYSRMRTLLRQNGKITCEIAKYFILIFKAFFSMSNLIRNILILFERKSIYQATLTSFQPLLQSMMSQIGKLRKKKPTIQAEDKLFGIGENQC